MQDNAKKNKLIKLLVFNSFMLIVLVVYFLEHSFPDVVTSAPFSWIYNILNGENYNHLELPLVFVVGYLLRYNDLIKGVKLNSIDTTIGLLMFTILSTGVVNELIKGKKDPIFENFIFPMIGFGLIFLVFSYSLVALVQLLNEKKK